MSNRSTAAPVRPNIIDLRAIGAALGRNANLQQGLGLAIQLGHGSPDYYSENLRRKEHLDDRAHGEKLAFERLGAQFTARERLAQEQAAAREKAHRESLDSAEGRAAAGIEAADARHAATLKQHGEDADRRVTAAEAKGAADVEKRDEAERGRWSKFYQGPAGQDVVRERLKTAAGEVPFLGPSLATIAKNAPELQTARDRADAAVGRSEGHKATSEGRTADMDAYRKQRDAERAEERKQHAAEVAAAKKEGGIMAARRAATAAVEASPFFLKATPEQKREEIERRVTEATTEPAESPTSPTAPPAEDAPAQAGPTLVFAPSTSEKALLFGPAAQQAKAGLFGPTSAPDAAEGKGGAGGGFGPGGRAASRTEILAPGRTAPLLSDWDAAPTGTTPGEAAARDASVRGAASANDATFPAPPDSQAPAEHLAALQEAVRRLHAQNAPPPSEAQGIAKGADQPTAPAPEADDAPPPLEPPPYVEDSETGREVNAYNVRSAHEVMADILAQKHPVARKYAIDALKADPDEAQRRGIDLNDLAQRFPDEQ